MGALGSEARCRRDNGVIKKAKDFQKKKVGEKSKWKKTMLARKRWKRCVCFLFPGPLYVFPISEKCENKCWYRWLLGRHACGDDYK